MHVDILVPFVVKMVFSPLASLGTLAENQLTVNARFDFWAVGPVPSVYMPILMPTPHFDYCSW